MLQLFKNIFIVVLFIKYSYCKYVSNNKTIEEINQSEYMISKFNTATDHEKQAKNYCDDDPCDRETTVCEEDYEGDFICKCKKGYRTKPGSYSLFNKDKCIEIGTTPEIKTVSSQSTDINSTINSQYPLTDSNLTPSSDSSLHFSTESSQLLSTKSDRYPLINSSLYHTTTQPVTTDRVQPGSKDIDQLISTDTTESTTTVSKDICQPNTCGHGECKVINSHYVCRCSVGYVGRNCEMKSKHVYDDVLIISILFLIIFYIIIGLAVILLLRRTKKHVDKCKKEKKNFELIKYYPVIEQSVKCLNL